MPPSGGPKIHPRPLHDCARLIRVAANRGAPSTVVYGFAIVSRNVSPAAMKQTPPRNPTNAIGGVTPPACTIALVWLAGANQKPPIATITSPAMIPPLYPSFDASIPAGS